MRKVSNKTIKGLGVTLTVVGLFGYILTRKNLPISFSFQAMGTLSAIGYCITKDESELNPLSEAWKELEAERERVNLQYVEDCKQFDEEKQQLKLEFQEQLQREKELSLEENKRIIELYDSELELYTDQLALKENLLRQAKLPKLASGISRTEYYANKIISYLYEKDLECDFADSWEEYSFDLIRLIPKNCNLKQLQNFTDELQLELRLANPPSFEITQGCIQIKIDTKLLDTDMRNSKKSKLELITSDWLPEIAQNIIHAKIDGETGSGKSTFVANLANCLNQIYLDAEFISIDPKYPLSLDWDSELADWQRKPKYPGIDKALQGIQELQNEIKNRLKLVTQDVQNGKKPREFSKKIYLIDEIDWVILEHGKEASDALQMGLKVGRALNVCAVYFGQTPRCSKLKMTKDDFRNSTNISLGSNVPDAINTYVFDDSYGKELLDLFWRENNAGNKYICLVSQRGKKPFLGLLPKPNSHKPMKNSETLHNHSYGFSEFSDVSTEAILELISKGFKDSEIVKALWGLAPSRSEAYKNAVNRVEVVRSENDS